MRSRRRSKRRRSRRRQPCRGGSRRGRRESRRRAWCGRGSWRARRRRRSGCRRQYGGKRRCRGRCRDGRGRAGRRRRRLDHAGRRRDLDGERPKPHGARPPPLRAPRAEGEVPGTVRERRAGGTGGAARQVRHRVGAPCGILGPADRVGRCPRRGGPGDADDVLTREAAYLVRGAVNVRGIADAHEAVARGPDERSRTGRRGQSRSREPRRRVREWYPSRRNRRRDRVCIGERAGAGRGVQP